jgi:hypothetical protein
MTKFILSLIVIFSFCTTTSAGECTSGSCVQPRKVVSVTKNVVRETVRLPKRVYNNCTNGVCRSRNVTVVR